MKQRIFLIDNLKYILIFLVVFGHYIEPFIHDNAIMMSIYKLIYSFHMPLFAFASGFFAKPYTSIKDLKTPILQFITFEIIYGILIGITILIRPEDMSFFASQVTTSEPWNQLMLVFTPIWILWYLWAMICWRGLVTFIPKKKSIIPLTFIVALLIGLVTIFDGAFSIQRVFCFFPFYYIGYYMDIDTLKKVIKTVKPYTLSLIITIPISIYLMGQIEYNYFYFSDYYQFFDQSFIQGSIIRLIMLLWAVYLSLMVLCLVPEKENRFTKYGTNTLYIYLGHGIIMILILFFNLFNFGMSPLIFIYVLLCALASMYILIQKPIVNVIDILSWRKK